MAATHHHQLKCRDLLAQISDYIDGELEEKLCAALEQHLAGCQNCRVLVDTTHKTLVLYQRDYRQHQVALSEGVRARLWQALKETGCVAGEDS